MDLEDSQEKVRRNIVLFSAFLIGITFLDVKLGKDVTVFGLNVSYVKPFKLWIAITVVLNYVFLRYRFDSITTGQIKSGLQSLGNGVKLRLFKRLVKQVEAGIERNRKSREIFDLFNLRTEIEESLGVSLDEMGACVADVSISMPVIPPPISVWHGTFTAEASLSWPSARRHLEIKFQRKVAYFISLRGRIAVIAPAIFRAITVSKVSVDVIVPHVLFLAAEAICIYRLYQLNPYTSSWFLSN